MMDVTATILPSTVISDRSLAAQMALSAMPAASTYLFTTWTPASALPERELPGRVRAGLWADLHLVAVGHASDRVERTCDHLVADLHTRQHFEVLVAGDADFDRQEFGPISAHNKDAFSFLARLSRLELGRHGIRLWVAFSLDARRLHDLAADVVHELAYRDSRDRNCRHVLARGGRDVGGACEARAHVRHLLVEHDDNLEIRGLLRRRQLSGHRLYRAVADLGDVPLERPIGDRIDADLGLLAEHHGRNAGLVDFHFRLNDRHVGDRPQGKARVVHRAHDSRFAFLHVPPGDDARDRRFDADFAEIELRALQRRAILSQAHFLRAHLLLALGATRLC